MATPDESVAPDGLEAELRRDARRVVDAALAAVHPGPLVRVALQADPVHVPEGGRVLLVAVGKAAVPMSRGAVEALDPDTLGEGIVLAPPGEGGGTLGGGTPPRLRLVRGGHPLPDEAGVEGARAVRDLVRRAGPDDRILLLLSGGASALLALPVDRVSLADLRSVTESLLRSGADISDINAVRKHLELLKGGRFAREAAPAPVRALILSDVPGDRLDVIASGPVTPDPSTYDDAVETLERHGLWEIAPAAVREHLLLGREGEVPETPEEGDPCFAGVKAVIVGSAELALEAAALTGNELGYRVERPEGDVTGEAREVGTSLARWGVGAEPPALLLQAGETTVVVEGDGTGGRNQEAVLAAALELEGRPGVLVFSVGTDGVDGFTSAAGAMATGSTVGRAREAGLDAADHLARNDSHPFFDALDDLVVTGPTGTNVMDLMGVLVRTAP